MPGPATRGLALSAVLVAAMLTGCTAGPTGGPASTALAPAPAPSGATPTTGPRVRQVIDVGGHEVYGLAIHGDAVWAVAYQAGTVVKVDPSSGAVTGTVSPGAGVASLLSAGGSLWVAAYGGPTNSRLYKIDPATGRVVATIDPGEVCCDLTAGAGSVWAVDPRGTVLRIDPGTNKITARIPVTVDRNTHTNAVYAGDSLWVSSDPTPLARIRVASGALQRVETGGGVPFLARDGLVWGAAPALLWAVDEKTGEVVRRILVPDSIEVISLGLDGDSIWVGIRHPGRVGALLQLDARTGQVRGELRDIAIPARIEIGFGSVWVTDSGSRFLFRVEA
jgi:hypothetical protein